MEALWGAAKTVAAERESRASSDAAGLADTAVQQHNADQADTSTPREPPPVDANATASPPRVGSGESVPALGGEHVPDDSPPVLFPSMSTIAAPQQPLLQRGAPFDGPTVSIVLVKGDRVTLAQGAPAIFNLKPGRYDRAGVAAAAMH